LTALSRSLVMRLNKVATKLTEADTKASRVKEVESELGLQTQERLPPEQTALYRAIFRKLKQQPEEQPVIPPTPVTGGS
jgi:hypothetical protein